MSNQKSMASSSRLSFGSSTDDDDNQLISNDLSHSSVETSPTTTATTPQSVTDSCFTVNQPVHHHHQPRSIETNQIFITTSSSVTNHLTTGGSNRPLKNPGDDQSSGKLDNQVILLLEGLNERKSRIDKQVKFLSNLPKILPFDPKPPDRSKVCRTVWERWWTEHDRIEREADIFREDEFALMKEVAMSKTTNMSREDTDLVGLTLGTLEAFSRLEHLLRSRRKQLKILELRIKWDHQTKKVWKDVESLQREQPRLINKLRWCPPSLHSNEFSFSNPSTPTCSPQLQLLFSSSSLPTVPDSSSSSVINNGSTSSESVTPDEPIVGFTKRSSQSLYSAPSLQSNSSQADQTAEKDLSLNMTSSLSSSSVRSSTPQRRPSIANSSTASSFIDSPRSQSSVSAYAKRSTSTIFSTTPNLPSSVIPSSSMIRTPSYSIQSRAMRIQSLALQLSSLTTKFHALNRSIIPTSNTLDQLIDSGLHIPEVFLDEQDRLEAAVREMDSGETIKFYLALMDQYKESDEIWFDQRTLEAEIDRLRRDVDSQISSTRLGIDSFNSIRAKLDPILSQQSTQKARIEGNARVLAPRSKKFLDQSELNQSIILNLCLGSDRVQSSLDGLTEGVRLYKLAIDTLESFEVQKRSMNDCKERLTDLIESVNDLDRLYPSRHWELLDSECLKVGPEERDYEEAYKVLDLELRETTLNGSGLLETVDDLLLRLDSPGIDHNTKITLRAISNGLLERVSEARKITESRYRSHRELRSVRTNWKRLLAFRTEISRLIYESLLVIDQEKWKVKEVILEKSTNQLRELPDDYCDDEEEEVTIEMKMTENDTVEIGRMLQSNSLEVPIISTTYMFKSFEEAKSYLNRELRPLIDLTLSDLSDHEVLRNFITESFDCLVNRSLPELKKTESLAEQIANQTRSIVAIQSETDLNVLEGGRLMKTIQDLIGHELERNCDGDDDTVEKVREEKVAGQDNRLKTCEVQEMVIKFSEVVRRFDNSLPGRIQFLVQEGIEELKTEDGRTVLNAARHNELVRGHLNKLSMNLSGLADQVSNELSLLTWINGEPAKLFESASKEIRLDLEQLGFQLDGLEVDFKSFVHLIESNLDEPYFDFDRIESSLNRPMEDVQFKINSAEQWIKESVADQLESFINSCPSTSTSSIRIFKPELFILPKRMIHHQLQTLFKSISGRAVHIDRLRLEFINEVNRQRMIEFGWREEWSKQISQLRSQLRSTCDDIRLVELGAQSIDDDFERWAVEIFKARERHDLVDLILSDDDEPPPDYLQTLESFKTDLSSSCFEMIEPATNLIKEIGCQADELVEDINQKLPPLDYLSVDLVKSLDDSKNCLKVTLQICEGIRGKIERVSLEIEARRTEHEFRKRWRAQCKEISVEDLKIINNSLSEVCNSLNDLGHNRQALRMSYQQEEIDRTSLETLFSGLLENRRSLWRIKSTDIVAIDHSLELVRVKLDMVTEESDRLSKSDLPRPYLREIKEQLDSSRKGVERCLSSLLINENDSLDLIQLVESKMSSDESNTYDDLVIENFYRSERLELEDWKNERLYTLIRKIEDENKAVESILRMNESENFDSKAWKECLKNSTPAAIHPDGSSNSSSSSSSSSPSSSCSLSLELSKEVSKLKAKINRTVGLINSVEQISSKLVEFDEADIELRKDLEHYKAILPQSCYDYLSQTLSVSTVLKELRSDREIPSADFDPIEPISKRLDELRQRSNNLLSGLNDNLKAAQSVFEHVGLRKTHLKRVLRVFGQLNDLDLRSWIDKDSKTQHSPLPTQSNLVNAISTLEDLERELNDLGDSDHSAGMELIAECWQGLSNRRDTVVMLKSFVDFSELIVECDLSFSGLLDKLDELPVGERDEGVGEARIRAFKVLTRLREASTSIDQDPRIKYQIKRLNQTWEELCEMIKDRSESSSELPYRQTQNPQNSRIPVYSRSGLKSRGLMDLENSISSLNTPPPSKSSKRSMPPSLGGRMTFNSSPVTDSPSYMISQKVGGNLRSESQSESPLQRPNSSCDFNRSTRRSSSRQGFQKFNSLNSTKVRTRLNSMQAVQSTPPSSLSQPGRINSSSGSSSSNNSFTRHKISKRSYYTPQSNRNIDQQVGKVVNQLALSVHIAPAEGWEDNSGLYWIGEKVYFCRILRSQTVMVRIGGGWNELSNFLLEHSKRETGLSLSPGDYKVQVNGKLLSMEECEELENEEQSAANLSSNQSLEGKESREEIRARKISGTNSLTPLVRERKISSSSNLSNLNSSNFSRTSSTTKLGSIRPGPVIMATPPEAIQKYLRKARTGSSFKSNLSSSSSNGANGNSQLYQMGPSAVGDRRFEGIESIVGSSTPSISVRKTLPLWRP